MNPIRNPQSAIRIAVLMGGPSREREISLRSGKAVSQALQSKGYQVFEVTEMDPLVEQLRALKVNAVFIALHGQFGEDGTVQKILEEAGIPYTGSGPQASFWAMHKELAKEKFEEADLLTPPWICADFKNVEVLKRQLNGIGFPLVLKPSAEGSSIGLEIVKTMAHFSLAFERVRSLTQKILVEKFIRGRELTVGILEDQALPVLEIKTDRPFYDYEAKYTPGHTTYEVPAQLPQKIFKNIQDIAWKAHQALGCRDLSRVDILLDESETAWILEVNTIPGFTERSLLPKSALAKGISFENLCEKILERALCSNGSFPKKDRT
ncbi:MAG: D-alanine--D-alanine ligase [Chlamydiae bacterium]|nr:D-alanine--D-alanine ligase [Chlamydiota bacterium]MBI3276748.1 D-alanine--D-alanine ligase [Chlamydiota bacterium]